MDTTSRTNTAPTDLADHETGRRPDRLRELEACPALGLALLLLWLAVLMCLSGLATMALDLAHLL